MIHLDSGRSRRLNYTQQQMIRSQIKCDAQSTSYLVLDRNEGTTGPFHYWLLRLRRFHFWIALVLFELALVTTSYALFAAAGEESAGLLAFEANALYVGKTLECGSEACYAIGACCRLAHTLCELLIGAVIVVRLSRVVTRRRFVFADCAVLSDSELTVRLVSNRPSNVYAPSYMLEYLDHQKRVFPLKLTNRGCTAYLPDGGFYIHHRIDHEDSPFREPGWRDRVLGVRACVVGFDDLLASECSGCRYYTADQIKEGHAFGDMYETGSVKYRGRNVRTTFVFVSRINDLVNLSKEKLSTNATGRQEMTAHNRGDFSGIHLYDDSV